MHFLKRRAAVAIALVLTVASSAGPLAQTQNRTAKSFLWKVQSGPRVLYLAGSVHALSADVYPLNPAFERAYAASDTLVEEINLEEASILSLAPMLLSKAMFQDGRTFDKAVSKETADQVAAFLKGMPMGIELVRTMKPWFVMMMLQAMQAQKVGLNANLGLDQYFFDKATMDRKTVIGLETAESQIDAFDKMPETVQEQLLRSTLEELNVKGSELSAVVGAWQRGDVTAIERGVMDDLKKYPAAYKSLIVDRNNAWMPQIEKCLARTTPCMVVVGAAHLVGPDGLLTLLQRKGYKIEQQ